MALATCVTNLVTRHPSITASAAASVDAAAGGRTILGVGAGHSGVANVGGVPSRAADLREGLTFLKAALSGAPASWRGAPTHLAWIKRPVPVYAAASGPAALRAVGAAADGAFVNYGLGAQHVSRVRGLIAEGAAGARRPASEIDVWSIACLDVAERREDALEKLGNILGFVAAYILGPDPAGRGVPPDLVPASRAPGHLHHATARHGSGAHPAPRLLPTISARASPSRGRPTIASPRCAPPRRPG